MRNKETAGNTNCLAELSFFDRNKCLKVSEQKVSKTPKV